MDQIRGTWLLAALGSLFALTLTFALLATPAHAVAANPWSPVGSFSALGTPNIYSLAVDGGATYIGGNFQNAGGVADADYIAKWNGSSWSALGAAGELNGPVQSLAIIGRILYIGGNFTDAHGIANADGIVSYDLDAGTWSAIGIQAPYYTGIASGRAVYAMYVDTSTSPTSLIIGGDFADAASLSDTYYAARYTPTTDTYSAMGGSTAYQGSSGGTNARIASIARIGSVYYFGFAYVSSSSGSYPNTYPLLKTQSAGVWASGYWGATWKAAKDYVSGQTAGIFALTANGADLYVGGNFLNAGGSHGYLAKLDTDDFTASVSGTWSGVGTDSGCPTSFPDRCVRDITVLDGSVYFAGDIGLFRASSLTNREYPLDLAGAPPTVYDTIVSGGDLVSSGTFTDAGGNVAADYLAKFTPSNISTLDSLSVSAGALSSTFASGTSSYSVSSSGSTTTFTALASNSGAGIDYRINGSSWVTLPVSGTSSSIALPSTSNTLEIRVDPSDAAGTDTTYTLTITRPASSDATLSNLTINSGTLSPAFTPATTTYSATVTNMTSSVNITPSANHAGASVTVNGNAATSGAPYEVALSLGSNAVDIAVTPESGSVQHYILTVTRTASSDAALTSMSLTGVSISPFFSGSTYTYTSTVSAAVTTTTVTPMATWNSGSTITVNGASVTSGSTSSVINLSYGANTITTLVTAQDGVTTKTYTVTIYRGATDANLAGLSTSSGSLSPDFAAATNGYSVAVSHGLTSITVTPTAADSGATVTVNGTLVSSGSASSSINLSVGSNTITTLVTSQNAAVTKTYTITVTREAAPAVTPDPAPSTSPSTSAGTSGGASSSPGGGGTAAPQKSAQSAPVIATKLKVKKKLAISGKTSQGVAMSLKASGACKASGTMVTAGKKPGKCTLTLSAPATEAYLAFSSSVTIKIVK